MSTEAFEEMSAVLQGLVHRETLGGPHGCSHQSVPVRRQECCRSLVTLDQPGGHNADHPVMPMALSQQYERRER